MPRPSSRDAILLVKNPPEVLAVAPRLPNVLRTPSGAVELAPAPLVADLARLEQDLDAFPELVVIGRRQTRSNNSWLHNVPSLMRGSAERCSLLVHPEDAARAGLAAGELCRLTSATGTVTVAREISDAIRPGVVSLPHGWGHDGPDLRLTVAGQHPGVNLNPVTGPGGLDVPSGNAALNGVPVRLERIA